MRTRKEVGIRRRRNGWRVFAKVNGKTRIAPQFPLNTPIGDLRAARDRLIEQYGGGAKAEAGSFAADVATYLARPEIAARPFVHHQARYLALWLAALGGARSRASITRDEIETVLQRWLKSGLAAPTVYHRRTALRSLYATLGGPDAPNPVSQTTRPAHYRPVDRSIPFVTITQILAAMPATVRTHKGIDRPSLAKLRATVIAHTGIPPAELMKLRPQDFDAEAGVVRMPWRDKGAGTAAHTRQLSIDGVAAFVALDAAAGWGRFATERLSASFKRAARRVLGPKTPVRLYDLRHSFGADLYRVTRDLATVGRLLGHAPGSIVTARYAMGAHADVDQAALSAILAARPWAQAAKPADRLPTRLPKARKQRKRKGYPRSA